MTDQQGEKSSFQRVLVALDASTRSLAALEAGAQLAAAIHVELLGLFVEDINLLRLAELPFMRQVHYPSATHEALDSVKMRRQLKVQAEQARRALEAVAKRRSLRWSFRTVTGQVALEVLAAALESDVLSLGKASWPLTRQPRIGSTALAVARGARGAVLLAESTVAPGKAVLVVYDDSLETKRALAVAAHLAREYHSDLVALLAADSLENAARLQKQISLMLQGGKVQLSCRLLLRRGVAALAQAVRQERGGLLVLASDSRWLHGETMRKALEQIDAPVLLIR